MQHTLEVRVIESQYLRMGRENHSVIVVSWFCLLLHSIFYSKLLQVFGMQYN